MFFAYDFNLFYVENKYLLLGLNEFERKKAAKARRRNNKKEKKKAAAQLVTTLASKHKQNQVSMVIIMLSQYNISFMASKQIGIRWIRTGSQPYWKIM